MVGEGHEMHHWREFGDHCSFGYGDIACYDFSGTSACRGATAAVPSCKTDWVFIVGLILGKYGDFARKILGRCAAQFFRHGRICKKHVSVNYGTSEVT